MNTLHADVRGCIEILKIRLGLDAYAVQIEPESQEYGAASCQLGSFTVLLRVAKKTPTKVGQFVTLWKRIGDGPIMPFNNIDQIDFVIVWVSCHERQGFFIFPQSVLVDQGVFSSSDQSGKRALRVYPPWDIVESKQAYTTQLWQLEYFINISLNKACDVLKVKNILYGLIA